MLFSGDPDQVLWLQQQACPDPVSHRLHLPLRLGFRDHATD